MSNDKLVVIISGPSLREEDNVSGISSVLKNIIQLNEVDFRHFIVGSKDKDRGYIGKVYRNISGTFCLFRNLRKNHSAIYHSNTAFNVDSIIRDYVYCLLAKLMGAKVLLHLHGGKFVTSKANNMIIRFFIHQLFKLAEKVMVLSSIEKDNMQCWYDVKSKKIDVLSNCVDFGGINKNHKMSDKGEKVNLLFFGRIHESKGVYEISHAIENMSNKDDISLTVCGDGPLRPWFCDEMKKLLGDNFIYKGIIRGDDKWEVFVGMDYFLLPSRYGEGMPMALLETMSAGLVPITSDNSSVTNLVNESNGIVVKPGDSESLKKAFELLTCSDRDDDLSKSANCQKIIKEKYACSEMRRKLLSIYKGITS